LALDSIVFDLPCIALPMAMLITVTQQHCNYACLPVKEYILEF